VTLKETKAWVQRVEDKVNSDHGEIIEIKGGQVASNKRQDRHTDDLNAGQKMTKESIDALSLQMSHGFDEFQTAHSDVMGRLNEHQVTIDYVEKDKARGEARKEMLWNSGAKYVLIVCLASAFGYLGNHFMG